MQDLPSKVYLVLEKNNVSNFNVIALDERNTICQKIVNHILHIGGDMSDDVTIMVNKKTIEKLVKDYLIDEIGIDPVVIGKVEPRVYSDYVNDYYEFTGFVAEIKT